MKVTCYGEKTWLDQATDRHPVLVRRGGHNDVINSYARRLAGITEDTPVPPGGVVGRDAEGRLNGRLIDNAMGLVERRGRSSPLPARRDCCGFDAVGASNPQHSR